MSGDSSSPENEAPEAVADVLFAKQGQMLSVDGSSGLLANDADPDGDALMAFQFDTSSAAGGTVSVGEDGAVLYSPPAGFWGSDSFEYSVRDPSESEATAVVTIHVAAVEIPLSEVAGGVGGFAVDAEQVGAATGLSLGTADVNGDGLHDVLIGAGDFDLSKSTDTSMFGRNYVVFGSGPMEARSLATIAAGQGGFIIDGEEARRRQGIVSGAGDVNGDGVDDIIVGSLNDIGGGAPSRGRVYVVFGKADTDSVPLVSISAGHGGFVMNTDLRYDDLGISVSGAGDFNGDGLGDLVVGAVAASFAGDDTGQGYVVFGKQDTAPVDLGSVASGVGGFVLYGGSAGDRVGRVSGAGDVNGDGLDDIIIGASGAEKTYVVFGRTSTTALVLDSLDSGPGGFVIEGSGAGGVLSKAGDVNGDGLADIVCGGDGFGFVVFGKADAEAVSITNLAMGEGGFVIGAGTTGAGVSSAVGGGADVNADGLDDVVLGAGSGAAYIVYGKADTTPVVLSDVAAGHGGYLLRGEVSDDGLGGHAIALSPDINGDGVDDVVVSALYGNSDRSGRTYVVFGVPTASP